MIEVDPADNMDYRYQIEMLKDTEGSPAGWELIETGKYGEQSIFRFNDQGILVYHIKNTYDKTYEGRHPGSHGIYLQEEIHFDEDGIMTEWSRWGFLPEDDQVYRTRLDINGKIIDSEYPKAPRFKEGDTVYLYYDTGLIESAYVEITASGFVFIDLRGGICRRIWVPEDCLYATEEAAEAALK